MLDPETHVLPTPTSKRAHKLKMLCTVSMALVNHHTLLDVGVDATFSETSLHKVPTACVARCVGAHLSVLVIPCEYRIHPCISRTHV